MTYTYLDPKDTADIQDYFVEWLNNNLPDPYEQRTNKTRTNFVYGEDFKLVAIFPKIHFSAGDYVPNKISTQGKTDYLEAEEHHFLIYYHNQLAHRYTFDNGATLSDGRQTRKYLQYVRDKIKKNADNFDDYCHQITFGTVSKPIFNRNSKTWIGMIPITVITYKR